ncbi:MAG: hypothetical protein M3Q58_11305 [Bacteroidota bacterium]|nr:hypothetical protein [Bacteroidota bacterium]
MINSFKNTAHILLAVFLLLSSIGISVNKMICLSGGKTTFSLLEKKSCFPLDEEDKNTENGSLDVRCCDFVTGYVQVDLLSIENVLKIKEAQIVAVFSFLAPFQTSTFHPVLPQVVFETPPLFYGVSILTFINIFRI